MGGWLGWRAGLAEDELDPVARDDGAQSLSAFDVNSGSLSTWMLFDSLHVASNRWRMATTRAPEKTVSATSAGLS